jgi:hypothetical protein
LTSSRYDLKTVEDGAEAHGAEYFSQTKDRWIKCGNTSHAACFSFYAKKIITTGGGEWLLAMIRQLQIGLLRIVIYASNQQSDSTTLSCVTTSG